MTKIFFMGEYDVIVIGAGHAGCEAALISARMGVKTLLLTITLDAVAMLACNPSIGGTGKGHLVREIDALGGEMGKNIDKAFIQSRMINTAKGPAVHSLRAQADKRQYHIEMKKILENQENLDVKQAEVVEIIKEGEKVTGVVTKTGARYDGKAIIIATGTFLNGRIFIGEWNFESGPDGLSTSILLSEGLKNIGVDLRRFKTGTPARVDKKTLNLDKMLEQPGDNEIVPFSFSNEELYKEQVPCYLTYTNKDTHQVILENIKRSALYGGQIEGIGPRYCPSIEDKLVRFADKERHQLFIEPEGLDTDEMYVQGMSTSLPEDVQEKFYRTIEGMENVKIVRPAYAIEYDCINSTDLKLSLEHKKIENLFCAGQFNGSSGYEEAAAQGLMAGINAVQKIRGKEPFVLDRSEAYIGVLIDDLVTKGTSEPYRIMTSKAEYRLILRQDNADLRLVPRAFSVGSISDERYRAFLDKKETMEKEMQRLQDTQVYPKDVNNYLMEKNSTPLKNKVALMDLLRRPELTYQDIKNIDKTSPLLTRSVEKQIEIQVKYSGYIDKQLTQIEKFKRLEKKKLNENIDYMKISGLRIEAKQKLSETKPLSVGQASRMSGVSPADINVLLIYLERERRISQNED